MPAPSRLRARPSPAPEPALARLGNRAKYLGFALAACLAPRLPLAVAYAAAALVAEAACALTPGRRRSVAANLRHVLDPSASPAEIARLCRGIYRSVALAYVDFLRIPTLDLDRFARERLELRGYAWLTRALAEGHGAILATIHYGDPEIAIQALRGRGVTALLLTEQLHPPELAALSTRIRASHGHRYVTAGLGGAKQALRTLRRGGIVVLAVDRDVLGTGIEVPFFGAPARVPRGPVDLARLSGAPVLPAISQRVGGRIRVTIEPRLDLSVSSARDADAQTNTTRLLARFEATLRRDPSQWLVLEPVWRRPRRP